MNKAQKLLRLVEEQSGIRPATVKDQRWIQAADRKTYGNQDAWTYTPDQWKEAITSKEHPLQVHGKAYMQTTHFPERGHYLTTLAGKKADAEHLLKNWIGKRKKGERLYTHADPRWMNGKIVPFLQGHGFRVIGTGQPHKETGTWAMDISKLHELELMK